MDEYWSQNILHFEYGEHEPLGVQRATIGRKLGKTISQGIDYLEEYARAIELILQHHDGVEVVRRDGTMVRLK